MNAVMELLGEVAPGRSPAAVRNARHQVHDLAAKVISDPDVLYNVGILASEAITNAYVHGTGQIRVTVAAVANGAGGAVRVDVADEGPAEAPGNGRVDHGRGLMLVEALAARWATEESPSGTLVWFEVGYQ